MAHSCGVEPYAPAAPDRVAPAERVVATHPSVSHMSGPTVASAHVPAAAPRRSRRRGRGGGPSCILILDVHPAFSRMLRPTLRGEGMAVHEVGVGSHQAMVAAVARHGTGMILLELALSRARVGTHTGSLVAALTANGNPVLAVRGHGDEDAAASAIAAGAVGVVSKDLPLPDLVTAMLRADAGLPVVGPPR